MACAKLVAHRRSVLYFLAAGAGLRFGILLLDKVVFLIIPVLNWNVVRLLIVTVHYLLPMWLLIIIFVHLANCSHSKPRNAAMIIESSE